MEYGERMRELMRERKITQIELSEIIKVKQQTISGWLRVKYVPLKALEKFCVGIGIEMWEFFTPKEKIAEHFKISPEALALGTAFDILKPEQKAATQSMVNHFLVALAEQKDHS